jgi:hypothetical protein
MVEIVIEEDIMPHIGEFDVILVPADINQTMLNGFIYDITEKYPYIKEKNLQTKYGDFKKLGTVMECKEEGNPIFVLCFITRLNTRPDLKSDILDYEALKKCLVLIDSLYPGKKIGTTFIGSSPYDGNGDKEKILKIVNEAIKHCDLTLFDYVQIPTRLKYHRNKKAVKKLKIIDYKLYKEKVKKYKDDKKNKANRGTH